MLSQLQFPGMPEAQSRVTGEKSRPTTAPVEPHGDDPSIKGAYDERTGYFDSHGGQWISHDAAGAGIRHITRGGYNPERQHKGDWEQEPTLREVPIQNANGPIVWSHQEAVSRNRLDQLARAPHTAGIGEVATGSVNPLGEVTLYDGNHRTTRALLDNQMFQPMATHQADIPRQR